MQTRFLFYSQEDLITFPLQDEVKLKNLDFYNLICKDLEETNEKNRLIFVKLSNSVTNKLFEDKNCYFEKLPKIINGIDLYGEHVNLNSLEVLLQGLMKTPNNIIKLDLDSCSLHDDSTVLISNFLKSSKKLSILLLRKNSITSVGMKELAEGVLDDSPLVDFDIAFNLLGNVGCKYVAELLDKAKKLKKLFISGNNIGAEGIEFLNPIICKHPSLYYISLINNHMNDNTSLRSLFQSVLESKVIQKLNIGYNKFNNDHAEVISNFIKTNKKLRKIFLFQLQITSKDGVKKLSEAIGENTSLEFLNFKDSNFGQSFNLFPKFLSNNPRIIRLNLFNNYLYDKDVEVLVKHLFANKTLEVLNLGSNKLTDVGAISLASLISHNNSLKEIDISFNKLGTVGAEYILNSLRKNKTLIFLNLKKNDLEIKAFDVLLEILKKHNFTIEYINLKKNEINFDQEDLEDFRELLKINKKIKFIGLSSSPEGYEKLFLKNVLRDNLLKNKYDLD